MAQAKTNKKEKQRITKHYTESKRSSNAIPTKNREIFINIIISLLICCTKSNCNTKNKIILTCPIQLLIDLFKEYFQFLNRLHDITWFGTLYA